MRLRIPLAVVVAAITAELVPARLCGHEAGAWFHGATPTEEKLEAALAQIVSGPLSAADFPTGSRVIDGEWLFGTYMMAALGFAQMALEHPERRPLEVPRIEACVAQMIGRRVRAFDTEAWDGDDALLHLDEDEAAHVSYLGYLNLALSLERLVDPDDPHAALNDRVTAALARRLSKSPTGLLPSYPRSTFPVDNTAAVASLAVWDRATRSTAHAALIARFDELLRRKWVDRKSGLLHQTEPHGAPRGSGTALAAYFLSFADRPLSAELLAAMRRSLYGSVLGFGAVREYPRGRAGRGDADSGPLLFGFGVSATGFALGAARANGDEELFGRLYATVELFGAPSEHAGARRYTAGGAIGNAILFAMMTAPRSLP
jgi:hypothetical protein